MTCGIYRIRCSTDECYWGSSNNIERRFREHKSFLKRKKHVNLKLQELYNEKGIRSLSFEIIEECSIFDLEKKERYYLDSDKNKLNIWILPFSPKGCKRQKRNIFTEETKKKISESLKKHHIKYGNSRLGKTHSEETKNKIGNANRGRKWSESSKLRIKGRKSSMLGKKLSEEAKKKISESKIGKPSPLKGKLQKFPDEKICRECNILKKIYDYDFIVNCYRNICKKCRELKRKPIKKRGVISLTNQKYLQSQMAERD